MKRVIIPSWESLAYLTDHCGELWNRLNFQEIAKLGDDVVFVIKDKNKKNIIHRAAEKFGIRCIWIDKDEEWFVLLGLALGKYSEDDIVCYSSRWIPDGITKESITSLSLLNPPDKTNISHVLARI